VLVQSAFVDEDDGSAFFAGFFLISGQRFCFRRGIAPSSRARVRPVDLCQLHPNCRTICHTCVGWYRIPHSRSINSATRADVHGPLSYPSASGPRFSTRSIRRSSAVPSCDLRPVASVQRPPSAKARARLASIFHCRSLLVHANSHWPLGRLARNWPGTELPRYPQAKKSSLSESNMRVRGWRGIIIASRIGRTWWRVRESNRHTARATAKS